MCPATCGDLPTVMQLLFLPPFWNVLSMGRTHTAVLSEGEDSGGSLPRALRTSPDVFRLSLLFSQCQLVLQLPLPMGSTPSALLWVHAVNTVFYY